jgi:DNA-binding MarR family transcriptional regulator
MAGPEITRLEKAFTSLARAIFNISGSRPKSGEPQELDKSSYFALAILDDSGPMRVSDLSARMGLDNSTVSRIIAQLTDFQYVEKQKDPIDGRVLHVKLAVHGEEVLHKACAAKQLLLEKATNSWSGEDRIIMSELMERLSASLRSITPDDLREITQQTINQVSQ